MEVRHQPADRVLNNQKDDNGPMKRLSRRSVVQSRGHAASVMKVDVERIWDQMFVLGWPKIDWHACQFL